MPETAPHHLSAKEAAASLSPETAQQIEKQPRFDFEELRQTLNHQVELMQKQFKTKHRNLLNWANRQGYTLHFLAESSSKVALSAGLVGSLLAGTPQFLTHAELPAVESGQVSSITATQNEAGNSISVVHTTESARQKQQLTVATMQQKRLEQQQSAMQHLLTASQQGVDQSQADELASIITELTGVSSTAQLEGYRLNTNVGRIGAEQHLRLYPGQTIEEHFASPQERLAHQSSGFAPGNGAYGVFSPSKAATTPQDIEREKYYVALQTFLSPNWSGNVQQTYNWFKYRKVIVYHPVTQRAVVAVVGDAGPALSTGKNYGGSPEVMSALSAHDGYGTPPVMLFFVDDPDNTIPLGPVDFKTVIEGS